MPRFRVTNIKDNSIVVIGVSVEEYADLPTDNHRRDAQIVKIRYAPEGIISRELATIWAQEICDKLNSFDAANIAVAKLT